MVERPIKKSERQIAQPSDVVEQAPAEASKTEGSQDSITQPAEKRQITLPVRAKDRDKDKDKDKTKGKGRGNQQDEERSKFVNPALMRGPKPTKSKPPLLKSQEDTPEDEATEAGQEETEG